MNTRKDENLVTIKTMRELENLDKQEFHFVAEAIVRRWVDEDFVDDDTGEIVSHEKSEVIFERGEKLSSDDFSSLLFYLQCGDIKEFTLSNQQRQGAVISEKKLGVWVVKAAGRSIKCNIMLRASNAMMAYEIVKDYIELNFMGNFSIKGIKTYNECIIVEPEQDDGKRAQPRQWYTVSILLARSSRGGDEYTEGPFTYVVFAETVEAAKSIIEDYVSKKMQESDIDDSYVIKMTSATTISTNVIIPLEFCMAYTEGLEDEGDE